MRNFVVITIPKDTDVENKKPRFEVVEGLAEALDKGRGKVSKFEVLPDQPSLDSYKVLVEIESVEPIRMFGVSHQDV